jgi:hypothetical protein
MSDISLPLTMLPFLPYLVTPVWALVGALIGAWLALRRRSSIARLLLGALLGSQLLPWLVFLIVGSWDGGGGATRVLGLGALAVLALVVVLAALNHAGKRR